MHFPARRAEKYTEISPSAERSRRESARIKNIEKTCLFPLDIAKRVVYDYLKCVERSTSSYTSFYHRRRRTGNEIGF